MLISLLDLSDANSGLKIIKYFSVVHKLQILLTGENGLALAINCHLISNSSLFSFNFHMCVLSVVSWASQNPDYFLSISICACLV